ncbi:hypothetical protein [Actinomadura chokoriensis]|uniref:Uncharacterized protein n=1 Tax=Actinomadura chokoriensis TaxID=454156 RepID=A0ABV4QPN7_9ACTN
MPAPEGLAVPRQPFPLLPAHAEPAERESRHMTLNDAREISYAALDRLDAEILPPRLAMSAPRGGEDSTAVAYACQTTYSPGTTGLLGTGLLAEAPYSTLSCVPAVTAVDHP